MVADEPDPVVQAGERGNGRAEPSQVRERRRVSVGEVRGGGREDVRRVAAAGSRAPAPAAPSDPPDPFMPRGVITGADASYGGNSSSVRAGSPSRASARNRKISASTLPPSDHAWTFCHVTVSSVVHGSSRAADPAAARQEPRDDERRRQPTLVLGDPGVHAVGVRLEDLDRLRRHRLEVTLRGDLPPEGSDVPVAFDLALAEELRQAARADAARDLHLPHALLCVDVALGHEQVVRVVGGDLDDPGEVADDPRARGR